MYVQRSFRLLRGDLALVGEGWGGGKVMGRSLGQSHR